MKKGSLYALISEGASIFSLFLSFLKNSFFQESDRHVLWIPVFLGVGILSYLSLSFEPPLWSLVVMGGSCGLLGIGSFFYQKGQFLLIPLCCICLGWTVVHLKAYDMNTFLIHKNYYVPDLRAEVANVEEASYGKRVVLNVRHNSVLPSEVKRVKVTLRGHPDLSLNPGDFITAPVKLVPINEPIVPGGFNFQQKAFFQGISASGYIMGRPQIQAVSPSSWDIYIAYLRHRITSAIRKTLPGEKGGIAAALITGDRAGISQKTQDQFADSGIAHVLAISGLHLSLVGGLLFFVVRSLLSLWPRVALSYDIKKGAALIAFMGVFIYLNISGASTPTRRAFLMSAMMMAAIWLDRAPLSMRLVSAAAVGVLLVTPESLVTPSFQLSFAAVVALIAAYEHISLRKVSVASKTTGIIKYIFGVLLTTLIASLATTPFTMYHFHKFTLQSVTANLLVIPLVGFWIMPAALFSMVMMLFGLEQWPLKVMGIGISFMEKIASEVSQWPGASITVSQMPGWGFGSIVLGALWFCLWRQRWRWGGAGAFCIGILSLFHLTPPDIVVASNGKVMGLRTEDSLLMSSSRLHTFVSDGWARWLGIPKENIKKWTSPEGKALVSCQEGACFFQLKGKNILFLKDLSAGKTVPTLKADIIIASYPLGSKDSFKSAIIVDFFDLWRNGPYAFWIQDQKVSYVSSRDISGQRPWSKTYKRDLKRASV